MDEFLATHLRKWGGYCEALFEELAAIAPDRLAELVASDNLRPAKLTFAAEILGTISDHARAAATLVPLLKHELPLVREGAIYGLAKIRADVKGIDERLRRVAEADSDPDVRIAAAEALA